MFLLLNIRAHRFGLLLYCFYWFYSLHNIGQLLSMDRIIEANLSWSRIRVKFCQLIASLSVLYLSFLCLKSYLRTSSLSFVSLSWSRTTYKLAINWQNFARVRLQLKFAFIIWPYGIKGYCKRKTPCKITLFHLFNTHFKSVCWNDCNF